MLKEVEQSFFMRNKFNGTFDDSSEPRIELLHIVLMFLTHLIVFESESNYLYKVQKQFL